MFNQIFILLAEKLDQVFGYADEKLVELSVQGDSDAFAALVRRYQGYIISILWKQVRNRDIAEELAQDSFVRAFKYIKSLKEPSKFKSWLARISLNVANSWFNSSSYKAYLDSDLDLDVENSGKSSTFDPVKNEGVKHLLGLINGLPQLYKDVVVLCLLESYTYSEAAEVLGIPKGTVASRMHVAIRTIRKKYDLNNSKK